jgi:hypothetical protein
MGTGTNIRREEIQKVRLRRPERKRLEKGHKR